MTLKFNGYINVALVPGNNANFYRQRYPLPCIAPWGRQEVGYQKMAHGASHNRLVNRCLARVFPKQWVPFLGFSSIVSVPCSVHIARLPPVTQKSHLIPSLKANLGFGPWVSGVKSERKQQSDNEF